MIGDAVTRFADHIRPRVDPVPVHDRTPDTAAAPFVVVDLDPAGVAHREGLWTVAARARVVASDTAVTSEAETERYRLADLCIAAAQDAQATLVGTVARPGQLTVGDVPTATVDVTALFPYTRCEVTPDG